LQHTFKTSKTLETYIRNIEREKARATIEKSSFEQHHGKRLGSAPGSGNRNMPGDSQEWQMGTYVELPQTSRSTSLSKVIDGSA
jgi:hypothetical protein